MADGSPFKPVRYVVTQTNGVVFSRPGRLYFADLRTHTAGQSVTLYDHTLVPQNLLTRLATDGGASAPFPPVAGVSVPFERGVYVSWSFTAFTGVLGLGWERQ